MALFPALSIAQRALLANEAAMGVVGNNIANVNTPGYSRQIPEFAANPPAPTGAGVLVGNGVHIAAITRVVDPLIARRLLGAATDLGEQGALSDQLGALAAVLNDVGTPSLGSALASFFDAADALARNPGGLAERQGLLGRATALARETNRRSAGLAELQRAADDRFVAAANRVNDGLRRIAELNRQIVATEGSGDQANELRDERERVVREVAGVLGVRTAEDEHGSMRVTAANGLVLVDGGAVVHTIALEDGAAGLDGQALHGAGVRDPSGTFIAVPGAFANGELAALAASRDVEIVQAASRLDAFAVALRDGVNAIQTDLAARDLDGNPTVGTPLFTGAGAADLAVALSDPRRIGAALSAEAGDNRNALRLADLRTTGLAALGNIPLTAYLAAEQARVGEAAAGASDRAAGSSAVHQQLENQRASVSGVNLNEELANLLKYQRAFQAASQVIGVVDEALGSLIGVIR